MTNLVIIGLGAAGFAAALSARKTDREIEITIVDKKNYDLMHPCGLPFALDGTVKLEDLKHSINAESMRINVISNSKVDSIDTSKKEIQYYNLKNKENNKIGYDKLIIASGSSPIIPKIKGTENNKNLFSIHTPEDVKNLSNAIKKTKKVNIIGAGAIGLETATALNKKGCDVTITEMLSQCLPKAIDKDMSEIIETYLKNKKIKLHLNNPVEEIDKSIITIIAAGVKPNTEIAEIADLKTEKFGIKVNEKMETSARDVYAVGDCAEVLNLITKKPWPALIASSAYKQGTIAGANAAGKKLAYPGTLTTFASVLGTLEVAATGFNSYFAEKEHNVITGKAKSSTKPYWFPKNKEITLKIIADKKTGKVLGAQAIGQGASEKINTISAAIKANFTLQDLSDVELTYCPAISQTYDVLTMAADNALRKIR
jgi:NADH oxidase (H2O2-forming)